MDFNYLVKKVDDRKGHDFRYSLKTSKNLLDLKWKIKNKFDQNILQTIKWYLKNKNFFL